MKKIVIFIPSIESGGVEKNLFILTEYLSRKNKEIFIVTANKNKQNFFGKKIKFISPKNRSYEKSSRFYKAVICFFLLIKSFKKKELVVLSFQSNIFAILSAKILQCKVLIRLNTAPQKYIKNIYKKLLFRFIYNQADEVIVNSNQFKKILISFLGIKSTVIYNFIEKKINTNKKILFFKNYKDLKIINIGRLTSQKDQITLIRATNLLKKNNYKFKLYIIGQGKKYQELLEFIEKNNLKDNIKLAGYKKDAANYIDLADVFVLSSRYEGLPNVLIESQISKIPIISSDCFTGPREILMNGKLGSLFKVGNHNQLYSILKQFIINNKPYKVKSKLALKYLSRFNNKKNFDKYYKLLKKFN